MHILSQVLCSLSAQCRSIIPPVFLCLLGSSLVVLSCQTQEEVVVVDDDGDGFSVDDGDCDDADPTRHPQAQERCDGIDNDCDGLAEVDGIPEIDNDGDGSLACYDCNDDDATIFISVPESCDGTDNDCDGIIDNGLSSDDDGDGFYSLNSCFEPATDCDDTNATIYPNAPELCDGLDNNCNLQSDEGLSIDSDGDGHHTPGSCWQPADDCNDTNSSVYPGAPELCNNFDDNCDGLIDDGIAFDNDSDGFTNCNGDCDDTNPNVHPNATEVCDSVDNDCDLLIDENLSTDLDSDGHYAIGSCLAPADDCDDTNQTIYPGVPEICDGQDNNCDGVVDEGLAFDNDADGFTNCNGDCDDANPTIHPNAAEVCDNIDNDCDLLIDEDLSTDLDNDGHYAFGGCLTPADDCDDTNQSVYPGAPEICDGQDNNCNGTVDEGMAVDNDSDGFTNCSGDCDDADPLAYPGAPEICDGQDNNCDGIVPQSEVDSDNDGFSLCEGDCADNNPTRFPGAAELCNYSDDNCDGFVNEGFDPDLDGDGYFAAPSCFFHASDCDDSSATTYPGAIELCDGIDNDCSGVIDDFLDHDLDLDGFNDIGSCTNALDCDDLDPLVNPLAIELCNGSDDNCDGLLPPDEVDDDNDGWAGCQGDCAPTDPTIHPSAGENCLDGIDNNCDGNLDNDTDTDGDSFSSCNGDCNDYSDTTYPGALEICDGYDNNCDGFVDEGPITQLCAQHPTVSTVQCLGYDGCAVSSCLSSDDFDADQVFANGCECSGGPPSSCTVPTQTVVYSLGDMNRLIGSGSIPVTPLGNGNEQWYRVAPQANYRPLSNELRLYFAQNDDDVYRFDVIYQNCNNSSACDSGLSEFTFTDLPGVLPLGANYTSSIGENLDLLIRVHRVRDIPGCQQYQLLLDFP